MELLIRLIMVSEQMKYLKNLPLAFYRCDRNLYTTFHEVISIYFITAPPNIYKIDPQPTLEVGMNIEVFEVYGNPPEQLSVCEVVDGDLREITSLSVIVFPVSTCKTADSDSSDVRMSQPNRISLSTSSSNIIGTVNLVITSGEDCSSDALTPEFSLNGELHISVC